MVKEKKLTITELSRPIPSTIHKIKGFGTLTIYQMKMSPFWYLRVRINDRIVRRSLKPLLRTETKTQAIFEAKKIYLDLQVSQMNQEPINKTTGFKLIAQKLNQENESRCERGELSNQKIINDNYRLKNDLIPFFKKYQINQITYSVINEYFKTINNTPRRKVNPLDSNSLKIHLSHIQQILKHAQKLNVIQSLPMFPSFETKDQTRGHFDKSEYKKLTATLRNQIGKVTTVTDDVGKKLRNVALTQELYDLIIFMMNTFIRPSDIKVIKHSHITIVNGANKFLRLNHPSTKSHPSPVVSLEMAVEVYQRILARQKKEKTYKSNGYVFMPEYENRTYGLRQLQRQFNFLLETTNLKFDSQEKERTLYSLRHSALMLRCIESENLDLLTLARNARTSPEMLNRFYLKYLTPEMNIDKLQSQKNPKLKKNQTSELVK